MINFPETIKGEVTDYKFVWIMVFDSYDIRVPLVAVPIGDQLAPKDWNCKYDDLTSEGKLQYTLLSKSYPDDRILLMTGVSS